MNGAIIAFLLQDGVLNGAIYALLGVALVLVFAVTRVVFIPQGEYVAYAALTFAALEAGKTPGTVWLLLSLGLATFLVDAIRHRKRLSVAVLGKRAAIDVGLPLLLAALSSLLIPLKPGLAVNILLTLAMVVPLGALIYRLAFEPLAESSTLVLLIAAVGVHLALLGLGLVFFGPEGLRAQSFWDASLNLGPLMLRGQAILILLATVLVMVGLWFFFGRTMLGKALIASAVSRRGAMLVGISTSLSGRLAFTLSALIGAVAGLLVAPVLTVSYDTGFLIGLKGFVAAIIAGLVSYPATVAAAIAVGILEAFSSFFASSFKEVIVFTLIIPILLYRSLTSGHVDEEEE